MPFKKSKEPSWRRSKRQTMRRRSVGELPRSSVKIFARVWRAPLRMFEWHDVAGPSFAKAFNKLLTISRSALSAYEIERLSKKLLLSSMYGKFGTRPIVKKLDGLTKRIKEMMNLPDAEEIFDDPATLFEEKE